MGILIKKFQTGNKAKFDPYAGLYSTRSEEASSTNQVPQNIRNLQEDQNREAIRLANIKEAKEKAAKKEAELQQRLKSRRDNPDTVSGMSDEDVKDAIEFTKKVDNPGFTDRVVQLFKAPARYITDPIAVLGDFDAAMHGSTKLPNTIEERKNDLKRRHGAGYLSKDAMKELNDKSSDEFNDILIDAGLELGTFGAFKGYKYLKNLNAVKKVIPKKLAAETVAKYLTPAAQSVDSYIDNGGKRSFSSYSDFAKWNNKRPTDSGLLKYYEPSKGYPHNNPAGYSDLPQIGDTKSSLDWGKWNKEIPQNKALMKEYGAIEAAAKKDGTWMKNADGSEFKGSNPTKEDLANHGVDMTPKEAIQAQFVALRSKAFKESLGEDFYTTFRGVRSVPNIMRRNPTLTIKERGLGSSIFAGNKGLANTYGNDLLHLAHKNSNNSLSYTGLKDEWTDLMMSGGNAKKAKKSLDFSTRKLDELENLKPDGAGNFPHPTLKGKVINKQKLEARKDIYKRRISDANGYLDGQKNLSPQDKKHISAMKSKYLGNQKPKVIKGPDGKYTTDGEVLNEGLVTDEVAQYAQDSGLDYVKLKNIVDGEVGDVSIVNHKPGNYLKSLIGNNGMFDMSNSNIYKAIAAPVGFTGLVASILNKKE